MDSESSRSKLLLFLVAGLVCAGACTAYLLFVAKEPNSRIDLAAPEVPVPKAPKIARIAVPERPVVEDAAQAQDHAPAVIEPQEPSTPASRPAVVPVAPRSETQQSSMVQGMVMKNGIPAQGFEVVLAAAEAGVPGGVERTAPGVGRTGGAGGNGAQGEFRSGLDPQGNFKFEKVPAGSYQLEVRRPGGGRSGRLHAQEVIVPRGQTLNLPVALAVGDLTAVAVAAEDGQPILGARVSLLSGQGAHGNDSPNRSGLESAIAAKVENNGTSFRFEDVPSGNYTLIAEVQGRKRTTLNVFVALGGAARVQMNLEKEDSNQSRATQPSAGDPAR